MGALLTALVVFAIASGPTWGSTSTCRARDAVLLGVHANLWSFMWKGGVGRSECRDCSARQDAMWRWAEANLDRAESLGAGWNVVVVDAAAWNAGEERRLGRILSEHARRGMRVAVRVIPAAALYEGEVRGDGRGREDGAWRKHREVLRAVTALRAEGVFAILVDNEVDGGRGEAGARQPVSYAAYREVLERSYSWIKGVDAGMLVGDHGAASHATCLAYILDLAGRGETDAAYEFWRDFARAAGRGELSRAEFLASLRRPEEIRRARFVLASLERPGPADFYQLHHYRGWRTAGPIVRWIRDRLTAAGAERPVVAGEIGYLMPIVGTGAQQEGGAVTQDPRRFREAEQADELVKTVLALVREGVTCVLYWQIRWHENVGWAGRLYRSTPEPEGFEPLAAGTAFERLSAVVRGRAVARGKLANVRGLYEIALDGGGGPVSVVWSIERPVRVALEQLGGKDGALRQLVGEARPGRAGTDVVIEEAPVVVEWGGP